VTRSAQPQILIGDTTCGYCHGQWGRDGYGLMRVEGVGADWIVGKDEGGRVFMTSGDTIHQDLWEFCHRNTTHKHPKEQ
jgi:hypothetical protein